MTKRLYYDNPYCVDFEAQVLARYTLEHGIGIVLDQTCFYPTSGGQPSDRGWLNETPVIDVLEEGETVVHVLQQDVTTDRIRGRVEWTRRFDHMQQHTGQHILSAAFERVLDAATESFHLGDEICTIDLNIKALTPEDAARVEHLANEVVMENRPIIARFYEPDQVATLPLRKPPTRVENIRIVSIQDFDYSPCGGTHCRSTGEVGLIKIRKWERRGQQTRVEFLCGWRAWRDYAWKHEALAELANAFSVKDHDVVETVMRLAEEAKAQRKELEQLRNLSLAYEAEQLSSQAPSIAGVAVVTSLFPDRDPEEVRRLALRIIEGGKRVALLGIGGPKGRLVFGRSEDVPGDMSLLLREVCRVFGGGGGGQPHLAQGGGIDGSRLGEALALAASKLQDIIGGKS